MHLTPRRAAWTAGITGCCTAAGLLAGPPPARAALAAEIPYTCATDVAVHRVTVRVAGGRTPARASAGEAIRPGRVSLDLAVPEALEREMLRDVPAAEAPATPATPAASGMRQDGTARLTGVANLSVVVSQGGQGAEETNWPVFHVRESGDGTGPLRLAGEGPVPGVVPPAPGGVTWTAARLAFALTTETGGTTTSSPAMVCTPERKVILGSVPVSPARSGSAGDTTPSGQSAAGSAERLPECIRVPDYRTDPAWDFNEDPRLLDVFDIPSLPDPKGAENWVENPADPSRRRGSPYCIRAAGFANVKKVGAATPVAALTLLRRAVYGMAPNRNTGNTANYFQQRGYFNTETMPSTASVLSFGFMPTTATATVRQVAPPGPGSTGLTTGNLRTDLALNAGRPGAKRDGVEIGDETWTKAFVQMGVGETSVNGVRLDLGAECGTSPTILSLNTFTGDYRTGRLNITDGSALTGHIEIPKFTNCGVGEDLSPLLTASISGPGNYVQIESGPWCNTNVSTEKCDETTEPMTWTVTPGGPVTITQAPLVLTGPAGSELRCESLVMKGKLREGHWNSRFVIGKFGDVRFNGCTQRTGTRTSPVELAAVGTPWAFSVNAANPDGTASVQISRVFFTADLPAGQGQGLCRVRFGARDANLPDEKPAEIQGDYDNASHGFPVQAGAQLKINGAGCATPPPGFEVGSLHALGGGAYVFDPAQKITQP
ncbi:hypothetical protein E1264_34885 [Actinomadura sp. KC216]|uniref:DUF6801 domain-containing protein n=1 Tax=Actinomadura sp. KC216 TaxID=2530370 RepID=UPI00104C3B0C|nr:DUF6801 domain-containing protein [Actinomadura sp. KC216]TDB79881.1 hypothetical protein E1264_34885 [Actinomadura sp. KC216]